MTVPDLEKRDFFIIETHVTTSISKMFYWGNFALDRFFRFFRIFLCIIYYWHFLIVPWWFRIDIYRTCRIKKVYLISPAALWVFQFWFFKKGYFVTKIVLADCEKKIFTCNLTFISKLLRWKKGIWEKGFWGRGQWNVFKIRFFQPR